MGKLNEFDGLMQFHIALNLTIEELDCKITQSAMIVFVGARESNLSVCHHHRHICSVFIEFFCIIVVEIDWK